MGITICFPARIGYDAASPAAGLAQLVEQRFCKPWVGGSSPSAGTISQVQGVSERQKIQENQQTLDAAHSIAFRRVS